MLTVQNIMTPIPTTVTPDTKVWEAANLMLDLGVSGLPVVNRGDQILGVLSESDFLWRREVRPENARGFWHTLFSSRGTLAKEYAKSFGKNVEDLMTSPAVTVDPLTTVESAAFLMAERNIKRLPVVADGQIVGIVTRSDVMRSLIRAMAFHSVGQTSEEYFDE